MKLVILIDSSGNVVPWQGENPAEYPKASKETKDELLAFGERWAKIWKNDIVMLEEEK